MTNSFNSSFSSIKILEFSVLAQTQKPTKEITYFAKDLSLFVDFPFWNFIHFATIYTFSYFSISLTKSLFFESNITHDKNHSSSNYNLMYLLYLTSISLILHYILQTQSSQNIHAHFSYIFKLHVSQRVCVCVCIYIYTSSIFNKVSTYTSHIYYKQHISQNMYISYNLHTF